MTRTVHFLTFLTTKIIFKLFLNFKVYGKENLRNIKNGAIFISNHESYFDPFIISSGLSVFSQFHPIHYLTEESFFATFWGKLSKFGSPIPAYLKNGVEYSSRLPLKMLWKKHSVGVFNEWCYKKQPLIDRVNKLIILLSQEANKPIVPVYIFGIENLTWKKILKRQSEVLIFYGKPFIAKHELSENEKTKQINNALSGVKKNLFDVIDQEEVFFWANYGKLYHHIETVKPYKELVSVFSDNVAAKGKWLDLGSGSGGVVDLLNKNSDLKVIASDFDPGFLKQLKSRFEEKNNIEIQKINLCDKFNFQNDEFDGVTANLVLPYIIHHADKVGVRALEGVLMEIFRILKPGGQLIWSTPKKGVKFWKVFLASKEKVFGFDNKERLFYGPALLKQSLRIQNKGKRNKYHFLAISEIEKMLISLGFECVDFYNSMAKQVNVIKCKKPL